MKRTILVCALFLLVALLLSRVLASREEIFVEPTGGEWAKMTPVELESARKKMEKEGARQRAASSRYQQDQKDGVCHVHKEKMESRTVKIPLGMPDPKLGPVVPRAVLVQYRATAAEKFPNAIESVPGSCIPMPNGQTKETIHACASCVAARRKAEAELGITR